MAWTPVGGEILYVESLEMDGDGQLKLTGQLGDVMKESAQIAYTWIKRLHPEIKNKDIHIHFPAGATPKDGPSAGIALASALKSLIMKKPLSSKMAMTGELSLSGEVLPVGGIKEKVMGAHRAGVTKVIIPKQNEKNVQDIPKEIRDKMEIHFAETIENVFSLIDLEKQLDSE